MPFYTFKCPSCKVEIDILQGMNDSAPICKKCSEASLDIHKPVMEKLISIPAKPKFKGKGFYETDYKKKGIGMKKGEADNYLRDISKGKK